MASLAPQMNVINCRHIPNHAEYAVTELNKAKENGKCSECDSKGPNLWFCMYPNCYMVGCGEQHNDHSTLHNKTFKNHCIHMNLWNKRVWCYLCENEIYLDSISHFHNYQVLPPSVSNQSPVTNEDDMQIDGDDPHGLTGLQNIGNTCYMNSALQALSNTVALTQYFLDFNINLNRRNHETKPGLVPNYAQLMKDMWKQQRTGYVSPSAILYGIRSVYPMYRGYHQHDTQEFLRCFMDRLHEELKEPVYDQLSEVSQESPRYQEVSEEDVSSQSEGEYETCDSGVSERSSLSEEVDKTRSGTRPRHSHSPSPTREEARLRMMLPSHRGRSFASQESAGGKKQRLKYRSIISDIFDGKILSSVQCLTCNRVSNCIETFQDLSLPIPSRDHLYMLHQAPQKSGFATCSDVYTSDQGWLLWLFQWIRSWFWGPTVSLHDCLSAFFSTDELKDDNMYSCEKCNKLRNGMKYSTVLELPEVLCIHLKRFRHELMFSSKLGSYVSFPLVGLDMRPYLHKDCSSKVTRYDLYAVICHHGTAGAGHYTCYGLNWQSEKWYEFDDQYVTQVSPEIVQNCEAYVLFYRKSNEAITNMRHRTVELINMSQNEPSLMHFYISKKWVHKFNTFSEPGPINNFDFLCGHGGVDPLKEAEVTQLCTMVSQPVWEYFYSVFGGGPPCNRLYSCYICQGELDALYQRKKQELQTFQELHQGFQTEENSPVIYAIAMDWFRQWQTFIQNKEAEPPGSIDNSSIIVVKNGQQTLKIGSDYAQLSEKMWKYFHSIYKGGPELMLVTPTSPTSATMPPLQGTKSKSKGDDTTPTVSQKMYGVDGDDADVQESRGHANNPENISVSSPSHVSLEQNPQRNLMDSYLHDVEKSSEIRGTQHGSAVPASNSDSMSDCQIKAEYGPANNICSPKDESAPVTALEQDAEN